MRALDIREHLIERRCEVERYSGVHFDGDSVTFYLWNLSGQMVGYQVYSPLKPKCVAKGDPREQKYFTYIRRADGCSFGDPMIAVWGLETYRPDKPLFLVEGVFSATPFHRLGYPCIALLAHDTWKFKKWLDSLPNLKIMVCDGDKSGRKNAWIGDKAIMLPEGLDSGDLPDDALLELIDSVL